MSDYNIGAEARSVEQVFRVSPDRQLVTVFACELTPDRLALACSAFLEWQATQEEGETT